MAWNGRVVLDNAGCGEAWLFIPATTALGGDDEDDDEGTTIFSGGKKKKLTV